MNDLARRIVEAIERELSRAILLTKKDRERLQEVVRKVLEEQ